LVRDYRDVIEDFFHDLRNRILGKEFDETPPEHLIFVGKGDFVAIGNEFRGHLVKLAGLRANHRVLEVGCGIGRMAIPLFEVLSENGSYEGFDIVPRGIRWTQRYITPKHPNFRFQLADIRNKEYNPRGRFLATEYRFPYESDSFDVVFLTSVFTHMLPDEVAAYLAEIHRVMKPGGVCLITWFILNEESRLLISHGKAALKFEYSIGDCLTTNLTTPEDAMCYPQDLVADLYSGAGLNLQYPIHFGSWCARPQYLSTQDFCIASKPTE